MIHRLDQFDVQMHVVLCVSSKSYVWSSLGVTAMAFLTGALAFWTPTFLSRAQVSQGIRPPCTTEPCDPSDRYSLPPSPPLTSI